MSFEDLARFLRTNLLNTKKIRFAIQTLTGVHWRTLSIIEGSWTVGQSVAVHACNGVLIVGGNNQAEAKAKPAKKSAAA